MNTKREEYLLLKYIGPEGIKGLRSCNAIIAGGAITALFTGQKIRDWDIYFRNAADCQQAVTWFGINGTLANETDTSKSYHLGKQEKPYQLIVMPDLFGDPKTIFNYYDFTVCMAAYQFREDGKDEGFVFGDDFFKHIGQRRLVFHAGTMFPICSMLRVMKYVKKGFFITGMELLKIGLSIHSLKMDTYADLRRQLQGIDTAFLADLTAQMKPDEPLGVKKYIMEEFMTMMEDFVMKHYEHLAIPGSGEGEE
jgi:hypothetical protein